MSYSSSNTPASHTHAVLAAVSLPWGSFVAMFLYYVGLTLLAIGGTSFSPLVVAVAYLLPVVGYVATLLNRGIHALIALPIELGETPHALQH